MTKPSLHWAEQEVERQLLLQDAMPVTQHEYIAAICRPPALRTPFPAPGDWVWYRHDPFGALTEAEVESVDISNPRDQYVWRYAVDPASRELIKVEGKSVMEMVDDPWPDVYLKTRWGRIVTREARLNGSPGWLPREAKAR